MTFAKYMRSRVGEMLLVFLSAWGIAQVAFNAFYIDEVQHTVIVPVVIAVFVLLAYAVAWRRKTLLVGVLVCVFTAAVFVGACMSLSVNPDGAAADQEGNYFYFAAVIVMCAYGCFLLTRSVPGCVVWFVGIAFTCSAVQAFYRFDEYAFSIIACVAALVLVVYRNYMMGLLDAKTLGKMTRTSAFAASVVPVFACLFVALGVWFGVLMPLNPPTLNVKFFTEYLLPPVEEHKGVAEQQPVFDFSLTTQNLSEGDRYTTDDLEISQDANDTVNAQALREHYQAQQSQGNTGGGTSGGEQNALNPASTDSEFDQQSYSSQFLWWIVVALLALLAIAAIVAYFLLRRKRRRERFVKMLDAPPKDQVSNIYLFVQERLSRLGFKVPAGMTLAEFARNEERRLDVFTSETGVSFTAATEAYCKCSAYGREPVTQDDVACVAAWYDNLWRAARAYLGNIRYFFKSFRL